jgi:Lipocalin-like domain
MEIGFVRSRDSSDRSERVCYGTEPDGIRDFYPDPSFIPPDGEARKPAKTVQERADLLNTLVAYTGTYRLEGEEWITNVDVAWNPEWIGTEQKRFFKLEGDRLQVLATWRVHPNWPDKGMTRRILTFER